MAEDVEKEMIASEGEVDGEKKKAELNKFEYAQGG
jgi:hypothetical protein